MMSSNKRKNAAQEERLDDVSASIHGGRFSADMKFLTFTSCQQDDEGSGNDGGNANSSSARKAQNRIAQREFRLRKQQYVRDLEAKVEMLSGDREERVELMTVLIRNLLKENTDLRGMVRSMSIFIGEGMGSCLPRLGMTSDGLDAILSRADTNTAYEAFTSLKNAREAEAENPPPGVMQAVAENSRRKRKTTAESSPAPRGSTGGFWSPPAAYDASKRSRLEASPPKSSQYRDLFAHVTTAPTSSSSRPPSDPARAPPPPGPPGPPQLGTYSDYSLGLQMGQPPQASAIRGDGGSYHQQVYSAGPSRLPDDRSEYPPGAPVPPYQAQPSMFQQPQLQLQLQSAPSYHPQQYGAPTLPPINSFAPSQHQSRNASGLHRNLTSHSGSPDMSYQLTPVVRSPPNAERQTQERVREALLAVNAAGSAGITPEMRDKLADALGDGEEHDKKREALELISYHLNNFKSNPNYVLPTSLTPTVMQRSIPHEHAIDGIIFPVIRERMITYRGKYDLLDAMNGLLTGCRLHGDDTLDHRNWEFSEQWLSDFSVLTTQDVYDVTNKWRAERGGRPLIRPERPKVGANIVERAFDRLTAQQDR